MVGSDVKAFKLQGLIRVTGGLTFKAVSACTVICMDLMSNPTSSFAADMRAEVCPYVRPCDLPILMQVVSSGNRNATIA